MLDWRRYLPHPALVFVALAWGCNFVVVKLAYTAISPPAVTLIRFSASYLLLLAVCRLSGVPAFLKREDLKAGLIAGFVSHGLYIVVFMAGMGSTGAAQGAISLATSPLWITVFSVIAKHAKFSARFLAGSVVAFLGVALVIGGGGHGLGGTALGTGLVLFSAVLWGLSVVLMKPLLDKYPPISAFTGSFPFGVLAVLPYGLIPTLRTDWAHVPAVGYLSVAYLVCIAGVAAFTLYYKGIADVGSTKAGLTQFFVPPTTALVAWLVFRDSMSSLQLAGFVLLLAGVAAGTLKRLGPDVDPVPEPVQ